MQGTPVKLGKNQFKCYHCRLVFSTKDGDWFDWEQMQVHLCRSCAKLTEKKPQRGPEKAR